MSIREAAHIQPAATVSAVEGPACLVSRSREPTKINDQAACDENRAQGQANSPTNTEMVCEDQVQVVPDAVVSEGERPAFEQGPVASPTRDQIVVCNGITGIPIHVKEPTTKLKLETPTSQHRVVRRCLSAALETLSERIVRKVVSCPSAVA